eukprot:2373948-Prymnesium_polylepis.1
MGGALKHHIAQERRLLTAGAVMNLSSAAPLRERYILVVTRRLRVLSKAIRIVSHGEVLLRQRWLVGELRRWKPLRALDGVVVFVEED